MAEEQVNKDRLYRALDHLLPHKAALEAHLKSRIGTLFDEPFDILLYDLTSTYFEGLGEGNPKARRGYSRDHRPDCVQVVIGLVVTKSGLPLGYEVLAGNQVEPPTLDEMMAKMEALYGKASRIWVFDLGVASERNLEALRKARALPRRHAAPYPIARGAGSSEQDTTSGEYRRMRDALAGAVKGRAPLAWAGGHEHVLEVIESPKWGRVLVSGAGIYGHETYTRGVPGSLYRSARAGYMRIDFLRDGRPRLGVVEVAANGGTHEAYAQILE